MSERASLEALAALLEWAREGNGWKVAAMDAYLVRHDVDMVGVLEELIELRKADGGVERSIMDVTRQAEG